MAYTKEQQVLIDSQLPSRSTDQIVDVNPLAKSSDSLVVQNLESISGNIATTPSGVMVDLTTGQQITGANLQPQPSLNFQSPQEAPIPAVPEFEMTEPEKEAQTGIDDIQKLTEGLLGESAFRTVQA